MKWLAIVAVFAVVLAVSGVAVVMWSRASGETASFKQGGVCVEAPSSAYWIESTGEHEAMDIVVGRTMGAMQIMIRPRSALSAVEMDGAQRANGSAVPSSERVGVYVAAEGMPAARAMVIAFHGVGSTERERLAAGVKFCQTN